MKTLKVKCIRKVSYAEKTYCVTVKDNHNMFAGNSQSIISNCDDPHDVERAESKVKREAALEWWGLTMSTRLNDQRTGARVIVMQRLNLLDMSGKVLQDGGWEHLCLPCEYEGSIKVTSIGWSDPRKEEGELLWPERFGQEEVDKIKAGLGMYGTASQLQQRPAPKEGGIIKFEWWQYYKLVKNNNGLVVFPEFKYIIHSWDTAFEEEQENDYSVCGVWGVNHKGAYLIHRVKEKMNFPTLVKKATMLANEFRPNRILVEKKASGHSLIQTLRNNTTLPIVGIVPKGDKEARLSSVATFVEAGRVYLPEGAPWIIDYTDELGVFPKGIHDDQVDMTSQALLDIFLKDQLGQNELSNLNIMGR